MSSPEKTDELVDDSKKPGSSRSIVSHTSKLPSSNEIASQGKLSSPTPKAPSNSNNNPTLDYASLVDKIEMQCPIHRLDIVKVCTKKTCREKMFFCVECIEEFAEHVVQHRPFIPISQYLSELAENPYTQRKARVEALQHANSASVDAFLQSLAEEKSRVADVIIPALKSAMNEICDQLQNRIFDEIDHFAAIYQYNSKYLTAYLDSKGLLSQILDQVPSFQNVYDKFEECAAERNEAEFQEYLEKIHRRILNDNSVEQTRQVFGYFEEIFDVFRKQGASTPKFVGEIDLMSKIETAFNEFVESAGNKFSNEISKYPICSGCNKELDKSSSSLAALEKKYAVLLQQEEAATNKLKATNSMNSPAARGSTSKLPTTTKQASTATSATPSSKSQDVLKEVKGQIEKIKLSRPGCCKGCKRFYCVECQSESICYGCRIELDPSLKSNKFIVKETAKGGNFIAMLDDTTKQGAVDIRRKPSTLTAKLAGVSPLLKKLVNIGLFIGNQEHFSGRLEWDVIVENYGSCHSIAFGVCKIDALKEELELNRDFKDITQAKSLILVATNGTVSGGLKGRVQSFQKEKNAITFTCVLDFGKNKFAISGKNVFLERDLENNQGYTPCFYSGCCFKSYNNLTIKQKFTYDNVPL